MAYILDEHRSEDVVGSFARYRRYLEELREQMPPSAYALATCDWYFSFEDHRGPHDAWLKSVTISEPEDANSESGVVSILIRLLGAYHDGIIEFHYPEVIRYQLGASGIGRGHQDWRYDEFRLSEEGFVIHEIEWSGASGTAHWIIEAKDVFHRWLPFDAEDPLPKD